MRTKITLTMLVISVIVWTWFTVTLMNPPPMGDVNTAITTYQGATLKELLK
jgi:hypothetical protein